MPASCPQSMMQPLGNPVACQSQVGPLATQPTQRSLYKVDTATVSHFPRSRQPMRANDEGRNRQKQAEACCEHFHTEKTGLQGQDAKENSRPNHLLTRLPAPLRAPGRGRGNQLGPQPSFHCSHRPTPAGSPSQLQALVRTALPWGSRDARPGGPGGGRKKGRKEMLISSRRRITMFLVLLDHLLQNLKAAPHTLGLPLFQKPALDFLDFLPAASKCRT